MLFYQGNLLLANKSSATCSASHLLTNIQGCNGERLRFYAKNVAGTGETVDIDITVQGKTYICVKNQVIVHLNIETHEYYHVKAKVIIIKNIDV